MNVYPRLRASVQPHEVHRIIVNEAQAHDQAAPVWQVWFQVYYVGGPGVSCVNRCHGLPRAVRFPDLNVDGTLYYYDVGEYHKLRALANVQTSKVQSHVAPVISLIIVPVDFFQKFGYVVTVVCDRRNGRNRV